MVLNGEEGSECVIVYIGWDCCMCRNLSILDVFFNESVSDETECLRKMASGRRVAGTIRSLVNARDLQLECSSLSGNIACTCSYIGQ